MLATMDWLKQITLSFSILKQPLAPLCLITLKAAGTGKYNYDRWSNHIFAVGNQEKFANFHYIAGISVARSCYASNLCFIYSFLHRWGYTTPSYGECFLAEKSVWLLAHH